MGSMQPLYLSQKKPNIFFEAYGTIHGSANLEMNSCWLMLTRTVEPGPSLSIKLYLLNGVFVVPADFGPCDLATPTPI